MKGRSVYVPNVLVAEWLHSSPASSCKPLLQLFTLYISSALYECIFLFFLFEYIIFISLKFNCASNNRLCCKAALQKYTKLQILNEQAWGDSGKKEFSKMVWRTKPVLGDTGIVNIIMKSHIDNRQVDKTKFVKRIQIHVWYDHIEYEWFLRWPWDKLYSDTHSSSGTSGNIRL